MKHRPSSRQGLAAGASAATILLTAAAFWLSYEHLHDVASGNGLDGARAWVWPATVDLFIVIGELLLLRASLGHRVDWWAIALTASGSAGSIALNVAGVGAHAPLLGYVVAAVPPVAALLAFGALMRQVHERLAVPAEVENSRDTRIAEPAAVLVERVPAPPVIKVPEAVPHLALDKAWKPRALPVPELPPAPAPELTAAEWIARQHKVRPDQIRAVAELLAEQPALSGKAIGDHLGTTDRYGRRVLAAAKELGGNRT